MADADASLSDRGQDAAPRDVITKRTPESLRFPLPLDDVLGAVAISRGVAAMIDKKDQKQWGEPELDKAQAENDAIFAEIDGLKDLVQNGEMTIEQAQARFIELLKRHRLVRRATARCNSRLGATPGNA